MRPGELPEKQAQHSARREPVTAYVALGANLGDADDALRRAVQAMGKLPRTTVSQLSGLYTTALSMGNIRQVLPLNHSVLW